MLAIHHLRFFKTGNVLSISTIQPYIQKVFNFPFDSTLETGDFAEFLQSQKMLNLLI